jgi:hypothetical protein
VIADRQQWKLLRFHHRKPVISLGTLSPPQMIGFATTITARNANPSAKTINGFMPRLQ